MNQVAQSTINTNIAWTHVDPPTSRWENIRDNISDGLNFPELVVLIVALAVAAAFIALAIVAFRKIGARMLAGKKKENQPRM